MNSERFENFVLRWLPLYMLLAGAVALTALAAIGIYGWSIAKRVDYAAATVLDCKGHGACLPAQLLATVGSFRAMAGEGAKAAPAVARSVAKIADAVQGAAENVQSATDSVDLAARSLDGQVKEVGQQVVELSRVAAAQLTELTVLAAPTLEETHATVAEVHRTVSDLRPFAIGTLAAAKVTLGEGATAMRDIQRATPQMLATVQEIGNNSARATDHAARASDETAKLMANLDEATKPLPRWLRYPLAVTGAVAPTAAGIVGGIAAAGVFR